MSTMLRVGVIGSGFGLYGLLPAFNSINNCQVVSICGAKSKRLLKYCQDIGLDNIYSDWRKMLDNEKLDALAIAVTPNAQYEIAKVAIKKNLNIFAEKPLAANFKQARELLGLAKKKRIVHAVDFIFPEIEEWQEIKRIVDKKAYGKLSHISVRWNFLSYDLKNGVSSWKTDVDKGGGALSFYFSHVLYYLEQFAGRVSQVKSLFSYSPESANGGEVGVDLLLKFKGNITGTAGIYSNDKGVGGHQVKFICEKATIILENTGSVTENFTIKIYQGGRTKYLTVKKVKISTKNEDERVRIVRKIANRFVKACIDKTAMSPSFSDGLRVEQLIDMIRRNRM